MAAFTLRHPLHFLDALFPRGTPAQVVPLPNDAPPLLQQYAAEGAILRCRIGERDRWVHASDLEPACH